MTGIISVLGSNLIDAAPFCKLHHHNYFRNDSFMWPQVNIKHADMVKSLFFVGSRISDTAAILEFYALQSLVHGEWCTK